MSIPSSGSLTLAQINTEYGLGDNLNAYRGATYYTSTSGPYTFPSGSISFSNFYGTQAANPTFYCSVGSTSSLSVFSYAVSQGWNQTVPLVLTINSGATITGNYAVTLSGSFPNGVIVINNGTVYGTPGSGGGPSGQASTAGGNAFIVTGVSGTWSIHNASYIVGGGGGGGGGGGQGHVGNQTAGSAGGTAIVIQSGSGSIINTGVIGGGGGGGGGGGYVGGNSNGSGGGGGGAAYGNGGQGGADTNRGGNGGTGILTAGGAGGTSATSGSGGAGGGLGASGASGNNSGPAGGSAGYCYTGSSAYGISISNSGSLYGPTS